MRILALSILFLTLVAGSAIAGKPGKMNAGDTITCGMHLRLDSLDGTKNYYRLDMGPGEPETQEVQITCNSGDSVGCKDWYIDPIPVPGDVPFGAHYIYRRWGNLLEDIGLSEYEPVPFVNPLSGETITVYRLVSQVDQKVLTNPPGIFRRYDGVEFFANKQFTDKLYLSGSLVYSKLTGNFHSNIFGGRVFSE